MTELEKEREELALSILRQSSTRAAANTGSESADARTIANAMIQNANLSLAVLEDDGDDKK